MVNDLEDRMVDISKAEQTKETRMKRKNEKKKEKRDLWNNNYHSNI